MPVLHFLGYGYSASVLLRVRIVSDKSCRENQDIHFMLNNFFSENRSVYNIMSKNMVDPDTPQMTTQNVLCIVNS